jgi:hypothetical protein
MELGASLVSHLLALSLKVKGKRRSLRLSSGRPFSFTVVHACSNSIKWSYGFWFGIPLKLGKIFRVDDFISK